MNLKRSILKLNTPNRSPTKAKIKDDPAKVKATGKPNNKNNKVVKNIITANTSGVI